MGSVGICELKNCGDDGDEKSTFSRILERESEAPRECTDDLYDVLWDLLMARGEFMGFHSRIWGSIKMHAGRSVSVKLTKIEFGLSFEALFS